MFVCSMFDVADGALFLRLGGLRVGHLTAKGTPFLQALKSAIEEQGNPQKGG